MPFIISLWRTHNACLPLLRKISASRAWQRPQTKLIASTPGGVAPWLPWQSLHVGAAMSPLLMRAFA